MNTKMRRLILAICLTVLAATGSQAKQPTSCDTYQRGAITAGTNRWLGLSKGDVLALFSDSPTMLAIIEDAYRPTATAPRPAEIEILGAKWKAICEEIRAGQA
jgi:hypothetical protein